MERCSKSLYFLTATVPQNICPLKYSFDIMILELVIGSCDCMRDPAMVIIHW